MISALAGIEEQMLQSGLGQLVVDELLYQRGRPPRSRYLFKHALIQDAAYQSLLKRTRRQYHSKWQSCWRSAFPRWRARNRSWWPITTTEANCPAQAIPYWHKAGTAAARLFAYVEAIDQFRRGLALVEALSDPRERAERELDLQMALGPALYAAKAYGHHPTSAQPIRGLGSSVGSSGMTPGGSRRSAACSSTMRTYSRWKRRSILPRRQCA